MDKFYKVINQRIDWNFLLKRYDINYSTWCWEWNCSINHNWYWQMCFRHEWKKYNVRAHRGSYMFYTWDIPEWIFVCHKCDNRRCINPSHLFLWTAKDNTQDMIKKWRQKMPPIQYWNNYAWKWKVRIWSNILHNIEQAWRFLWISWNWLRKRIKSWKYDYELL